MVDDLNSAIDEESIGSILDVFSQYSGDTFHVDLSNYSSVTNNHAEISVDTWYFNRRGR